MGVERFGAGPLFDEGKPGWIAEIREQVIPQAAFLLASGCDEPFQNLPGQCFVSGRCVEVRDNVEFHPSIVIQRAC